jgi:antirestriction protein ArdC
MAKQKRDLRMEVANRLVEQIEQGTAFFQRPWVAGEFLTPINAVTGKRYRGINAEHLMYFSPDNSDPRWCTYKQAQENGWQVREGSKGVPIEVWKSYEHTRTPEEIERLRAAGAKDIEPTEQRMGVRHYTVFHASQIDGIPPMERPEYRHQMEGKPDPRLDGLAEAMGVSVGHGGSRAFYRPSEDRIQLPPMESFFTASGYDTTFLHELAHATGHESRMSRDMGHAFGSEKYAIEELRAEMTAAMTAASLGMGFDPESQNIEEGRELGNSAAYLSTWLRQLPEKERKQVLMNVIRDAQDISDYLMDRVPELREAEKMEDRVESALNRGVEENAAPKNRLPTERPDGLNRDLLAFLAERDQVRTGIHHQYSSGAGDPEENAVHFDEEFFRSDPEKAKAFAAELRERGDAYAKAFDLEPEVVSYIALRLEEGPYVPEMNQTDVVDTERAKQVAARIDAAFDGPSLDPDLVAFLEERRKIRHAEHPEFAGLSDSIENAEYFTERQGRTDPQRSARWVQDLRKNPEAYGEAVGIGPDSVNRIAAVMEKGVQRMRNPQVGDLVRFEPHEPGVKAMPFSGRVIAALDTSGGDIRYHLRAESGPNHGIEGTFYGRDGRFREIPLEQAVGFDRALTSESSSEVHIGDFVMTREKQFGMDWDTRSIVTGIDKSGVHLQDLYRSGNKWQVNPVARTMARQDFDTALKHRIGRVVPADIATANLDSAENRKRFIDAVRSFDAEHDLLYGKTPDPVKRVPSDVVPFLGENQVLAANQGLRRKDRGFLERKMQELQEIVRLMPSTCETYGLPDAVRPVYLRYFGPGNSQWFILQKDRGDSSNAPGVVPSQTQAFGLADLGVGEPELGYINIPEITQAGAELDYHFAPTTLLEIARQYYPERLPPDTQAEPSLDAQAVEDTDEFSMPNMNAMASLLDEEDSDGDFLAADYF